MRNRETQTGKIQGEEIGSKEIGSKEIQNKEIRNKEIQNKAIYNRKQTYNRKHKTEKRRTEIAAITSKIKSLSEALTDAAFPRRCPVCGELVTPAGRSICAVCLPKLDFVREPRCLRCGRTVSDETQQFCRNCSGRASSFEAGLALFNYDDVMRHTVAQIKYGNRREYIAPLARMMYLKFKQQLREMEADCLVPVPVHPARRRSRGFNQAELLAREIGMQVELPVQTALLYRWRKTEAQKDLSQEERVANLSEAFRADTERIEALSVRTVILVDDIYTTGSTAEACSRVLKAAGVRRVFLLNLCIVPEV